MTLSQHLRAARVRAGFTQTQAAEFSGVSRTQICDLESGPVGVTVRIAAKLAHCYGISIDELTGYAQPAAEAPMNARERRAVNLLLSVMRAEL